MDLTPLPSSSALSLSVLVYGTPPFTYQWRRAGTNEPASTNAWREFNPAAVTDTGEYDVIVTTAGGSLTSSPASVLILPDRTPVITQQPRSQTLFAGFPARFSVSATGSLHLTYQWSWNGADLVYATNTSLVIPNPTVTDSGTYTVRVSNPNSESVTSAPARLEILLPPTTGYVALLLTNGPPVGFWRLDETPGATTAFDLVGGHNGAYFRTTLGETGALQTDTNTAARLNATIDSRVTLADPTAFAFAGTTAFSLEAWVRLDTRPEAGAVTRVFSNRRVVGGAAGYAFGFAGSNSLRFTAFGITDIDRPVPVTTGQWHHVVAVREGTSVQLYWNGMAAGTPATVPTITASTQPLQLGRNSDGGVGAEGLSGVLDEPAVFDRALTPAEVSAHYVAARGQAPTLTLERTENGLRLDWSFGTLEGTTNAAGPWLVYTTGVNNVTVPGTNGSHYFRVRSP